MIKSLKIGFVAGAVALTALLVGPSVATAQEDGPNLGRVYMNADTVTQYYYRGIFQENQGLIIQPYLDFGITMVDNEDFTLDVYTGFWNSLHTGPSGSGGAGVTRNDPWFELDWFIGTSLGFGAFTLDVSYINLYGPNTGASFAEEINIGLSFDDSGMIEGFPALAPYALLAIEVDGGSDYAAVGNLQQEGTYLELGIEPSFTIVESEDYPVDLSIPVAIGLSLDDYYQDSTGADETFGYVSAGLAISIPMSWVPADYGEWTFGAGVTFLFLGNNLEANNTTTAAYSGAGDFEVVGTWGVSMSY